MHNKPLHLTIAKIAFLLSGLLYVSLLYFTPRSHFLLLSLQYTALFFIYGLWLSNHKRFTEKVFFTLSIYAAIACRLVALFAIPELSDDYFRFIWDGRLLAHGQNPFLEIPSKLILEERAANWGLNQSLFNGLNSKDYFTIYPPVNQFVFWLGAKISPANIYGSILCMKMCIFFAELASLWLLYKLLIRFQRNLSVFAFYALNPLVIIELCGNLHFEAFMICFLLLSIWWFVERPWWQASLPFALAICSKLLPIMFFPLLIRRLGLLRAILFGGMSMFLTLLLFVPIIDKATFFHLLDSINLYFQKFEFNASIYYIVRWIGFQVKGYNIIGTAGKILPLATIGGIILLTLLERKPDWGNLARAMMWCLGIYLLFSSIVHPWYITSLLAFAGLSTYRWPYLWGLLIIGSYAAYQTSAYTENLWLVAISYLSVGIFLIIEISGYKFSWTQRFP